MAQEKLPNSRGISAKIDEEEIIKFIQESVRGANTTNFQYMGSGCAPSYCDEAEGVAFNEIINDHRTFRCSNDGKGNIYFYYSEDCGSRPSGRVFKVMPYLKKAKVDISTAKICSDGCSVKLSGFPPESD